MLIALTGTSLDGVTGPALVETWTAPATFSAIALDQVDGSLDGPHGCLMTLRDVGTAALSLFSATTHPGA